jgi:dGTPase
MVGDVIVESGSRLDHDAPADIAAVRSNERRLMSFGPDFEKDHRLLKQVLMKRLYRHERVLSMTSRAEETVNALFEAFFGKIELMPKEFCHTAAQAQSMRGEAGRARVVSDYIAGMTDRYAISERDRLFPDGSAE